MWWEPHSERDFSLANAVKQLQNWFREQHNQTAPVAWGVGSGWSYDLEQLVPLVLLNSEIFLRSPFHSVKPVPITLMREFGFPSDRDLPRIDSNLPVYCLVVSRPQQSNLAKAILDSYLEIREPIICEKTGKLGTAGVTVWDLKRGAYSLLTAGHVFPNGIGSLVKKQQWKFLLWRRMEHLGEVSHHVVPNGSGAEWDAAVIRLSEAIKPRRAVIRRLMEQFTRPEPIIVHGAISGSISQAAALQGALVEGGSDEMLWKNCWMIGPSGVLTSGDSGAAVFTRGDQTFLGVYVGTSYFKSDDTALIHYVQDAYTLERDVLTRWQVTFR